MPAHNLTLQRRLAASILKCGKRKVYLDPESLVAIGAAHSRKGLRSLIKKGVVNRRPDTVHSRFSVRERALAKMKGRRMGIGRRKGTKKARMPFKVAWVRRLRVQRRLLARYRLKKKIDSHLYRTLYLQAKGNKFKTKKVLIETIHRIKAEQERENMLKSQMEARKAKVTATREKAKKADAAA